MVALRTTSLIVASVSLLSSYVNAYGQIAQVVDANNFCVFLPPDDSTNRIISDTEWNAQAFCIGKTPKAKNAGKLDSGFIRSAHYLKTDQYVQVTGQIDPTKARLIASDEGGQMDVKAPKGSSCAGWKYYVNLIEPAGNTYCMRCCNDDRTCNRGISEKGCAHIIPGDYSGPYGDKGSSSSGDATTTKATKTKTKTSSTKKATKTSTTTKKKTHTSTTKAVTSETTTVTTTAAGTGSTDAARAIGDSKTTDNTSASAGNASTGKSDDATAVLANGAAQGASQDASQGADQGADQGASQGASQGATQGANQGADQGTAQGAAQGAVQDANQDADTTTTTTINPAANKSEPTIASSSVDVASGTTTPAVEMLSQNNKVTEQSVSGADQFQPTTIMTLAAAMVTMAMMMLQ